MRHAVILAGGGGTRLWPTSRRARPKQLMAIATGESLIGATASRLAGLGQLGLVTSADHAAAVRAALLREGHALTDETVLVEPIGRSTAAAFGLAAIHALVRDPGAVVGAFPADHIVTDPGGFRAVVDLAFAQVERADEIVAIGIRPTRPDPGLGYLALGPARDDGATPVLRFVEKPDPATAARLVGEGCLWNAGMFFARADRVLDEIERHLPVTHAGLVRVAAALRERGRARADEVTAEVYPGLPSVSFDHGVMERTSGVVALRGEFGWSDLGEWPALAALRPADGAGNVSYGAALTLDAARNLTVTDDGTVVVLIGVDDLVVVRSGDAVLVVPRHRAAEVKDAVAALAAAGLDQFI